MIVGPFLGRSRGRGSDTESPAVATCLVDSKSAGPMLVRFHCAIRPGWEGQRSFLLRQYKAFCGSRRPAARRLQAAPAGGMEALRRMQALRILEGCWGGTAPASPLETRGLSKHPRTQQRLARARPGQPRALPQRRAQVACVGTLPRAVRRFRAASLSVRLSAWRAWPVDATSSRLLH